MSEPLSEPLLSLASLRIFEASTATDSLGREQPTPMQMPCFVCASSLHSAALPHAHSRSSRYATCQL